MVNKIMLGMWILAGVLVMITGPTRFSYFCVWFVLILELIDKILTENER